MADPICPEGYTCSFTPPELGPNLPWWQDDIGVLVALGVGLGLVFTICYIYYWRYEFLQKKQNLEMSERADRRRSEDNARESREQHAHELALKKLELDPVERESKDSICAECQTVFPGQNYLCDECRGE